MPQAEIFIAFLPALWVGAGMLMIMDASFNIAMEPFRALVGDNLRTDQRTLGFSVQTALIGFGAVIGSWLPYILTNWCGVSNKNEDGGVPLHLILSFIIGAVMLIGSVLVTIFTTKEYTPEELAQFEDETLLKETAATANVQKESSLLDIFEDFKKMPTTMRQLSWVQFFSWFALFGLWVFSTPAIAHHIYGLPITDSKSTAYQTVGDWVGVLFGIYNLVSAFYAFALPYIAKQIGRKLTHSISLAIGGLGMISIYFVTDEKWLFLSMFGIGIAWASILAMPYAILAGSISPKKMGVYMGIFNFFIVIPQIINALIGGLLVKYVYHDNSIFALVASGISLIIAAILVVKVKDVDDVKQ